MTTRLWSMEPLVRDLEMKLILNQPAGVFGDVEQWKEAGGATGRPQLCGASSVALADATKREMPESDRCYLVLQYFAVPKGNLQLLAMLQGISGEGELASHLHVFSSTLMIVQCGRYVESDSVFRELLHM